MSKAIFWDFDGTIIHPNESFFNALLTALKKQKYEIPTEQIRALLQSVCSWYTPEIAYPDQVGQQWWSALFKKFNLFYAAYGIAEADRQKINADFKRQILDVHSYTLYSDAISVLTLCIEKGYRNYILSNNYPELPSIIEDLGLSAFFTDYIISSNIGYEKPRIELFQYALRIAAYPDICYMIGDNLIADIPRGKDAGMRTILVHRDGHSDAGCRCETLSEIPPLLEPAAPAGGK